VLLRSGGAPRGGEIYPFKESAAALYMCVCAMFDAPKSDRETRLLSLCTNTLSSRSFVARRPPEIFLKASFALAGDAAAGESDRALQVVGFWKIQSGD
jgi:hypothetical protein